MNIFGCYFLDDQERFSGYEEIEAETLSEATDRALAMLKRRPHHRSVEIWQGARRGYPLQPPSRSNQPTQATN